MHTSMEEVKERRQCERTSKLHVDSNFRTLWNWELAKEREVRSLPPRKLQMFTNSASLKLDTKLLLAVTDCCNRLVILV